MLEVIKLFVRRMLMGKGKGILQIPPQNKVDDFANDLFKKFKQNGVSDEAVTNPNDVKAIWNQITNKEAQIFTNNLKDALQKPDPFKKAGEVFDLKGKKIKNPQNIMGGEEIIETEAEILAKLKNQNKESLSNMRYEKAVKAEEAKAAADEDYIMKIFDPEEFAKGGRAGLYQGGQAEIEPSLSDIGHGSDALMARNALLTPGSQATTSTGLNYLLGEDNDTTRVPYGEGKDVKMILPKEKPMDEYMLKKLMSQAGAETLDAETREMLIQEYKKKIKDKNLKAEGGRIGYGKGKAVAKVVDKGRRGFMKAAGVTAAGIAALKTGLLGFGKEAVPVVEKAVEAVSNTAGQVPAYFLNLVSKIKTLGDDASNLATQDRQKITRFKDYEMTEDISTGKIEILKRERGGYVEDVYMSYKVDDVPVRGKKGSTKVEEYEEYTARPDQDGKMRDVQPGVPDEVVQEGTPFEDNLSDFGKADGGRIGYNKGKVVTKGIPALIKKVKSLFGNDAITTADKIPTPQKTLDRDMFKAADNRLNDKKMMNADELEDFEMEIGDNIEAYDFDGTVGDAKRILQEEADYAAEMFAEYKSIGGSKRLGGPKDPMKDAIDNASPGYTGDLKYDAQLVADDLAEKMYGVEYDDLTQAQQMDLYDKSYTALSKNQQGFKEMQKLSKPKKTLEGIKKTGTVDISDPDVAEEFTTFMKESDPKGYKDIEEKVILESFDPKGRKKNASGGLAGMLGE